MSREKLFNLNPRNFKIRKKKVAIRSSPKIKEGKRYKQGICTFVSGLFRLNETLPANNRMTDMEIVRQIRKEYDAYPEILIRYSPENPNLRKELSILRSRYNRGEITSSRGPTFNEVSFQYNEKGLPITSRARIPKVIDKRKVYDWRRRHAQLTNNWLIARGLDPYKIPTYEEWLNEQ